MVLLYPKLKTNFALTPSSPLVARANLVHLSLEHTDLNKITCATLVTFLQTSSVSSLQLVQSGGDCIALLAQHLPSFSLTSLSLVDIALSRSDFSLFCHALPGMYFESSIRYQTSLLDQAEV
jgi:hypothetical protein